MNTKHLSEPFHPSAVKWRVGSTNSDKTKGLALAYADARAFMDRLDEVCGPAGWQDEVFDSPSGRVFCKVSIKFGDEWVGKMDGAGVTDVEGEKGAISDAFKRACVKWGLGRYLYEMDSPWVALEARGKSFVIAKSEYGRLNALLGAAPQVQRTEAPRQPVAKPAPEPEAKPANAKPAPALQPTKAMFNKLHALGVQKFDDGWDDARHELIGKLTEGRTQSSRQLTYDEVVKLAELVKSFADFVEEPLFDDIANGAYQD